MARPSKAFKKFASSGKLKETIKKRRSTQQSKKRFDDQVKQRQLQRGAVRPEHEVSDDEEDGDDDDIGQDLEDAKGAKGGKAGGVARTVDELFGAGGLDVPIEAGSDLEDLSEGDEDDDEDDEGEDGEDNEDMSEEAMARAMADLEKNDPEFFKHLKAEDPELLNFGKGKSRMDVDEDEDEDEDDEEMMEEDEEDEEEPPAKIVVTNKMLRGWREGMLKQHSLRSLRKMLMAFRAAAHMNEDGDQGAGLDLRYTIPSAEVFNKLVVTALKFTPMVLAAHQPYKTLPNGRIKLQAKKGAASLDRLILSHFSTLLHLIKSLPSTPSALGGDDESEAGGLLAMAVTESAKLLPWVLSARKHLRAYLKVMLDLWSSASDSVRVAAFLAVRKMFVAGDDAVKDLCLRNIYKALLPPLRNTSVHTLPSLNLMKNSASELYQLEPQLSYQHAFTFIRMLAVHLRNVVRSSTSGKAGEDGQAFRAVYNWAFVHAIDFWSQVLAGAAGVEAQRARNGLESPLKPLIYPLTQVALGVVRLLPSSRYFPLRFHIISSLIRLVSLTDTYIPLAPFLLEILDSSEFRRANPKKATLKPLDLAYVIRAPAAYPKTRVYQEVLGDELVYLLGEYHAQLATDIAFPEIALPVLMNIRRHIKRGTAGSPKVSNQLKVLADKIDANRSWVEQRRRNVGFAPRDRSEVARFADGVKPEATPLGGWMRIQRKARDQRRREVEKALREESDDDE